MVAQRPLFNDALDLGTAAELRHELSAFFGGRTYEAVSPGQGYIGAGHGVTSTDAMQVSAQVTPNNTVKVLPGFAMIRASLNNSQGSYFCPLESVDTLEIGDKDAALDRVDLVCAVVADDDFSGVDNEWTLQVVQGTPGSGAPSVPEDALALAVITVVAGTDSTVITNTAIQDVRVQARTTGGIVPVPSTASVWANPQDYETILDLSDQQVKMWVGGAWITIGRDLTTNWQTYTPSTPTVTIGGGGTRYGRFRDFGKTVVGVCGFELGTGGSLNSTALSLSLPSTAASPGGSAATHYMAFARCYIGPVGLNNGVFWSATGTIVPGTNVVNNFASLGTAPWKVAIPGNWSQGVGQMRVLFCYEKA